MEILNEQPVSLAQLKSELTKIKKRDEELNYRAGRCEDYLNQVVKINVKQAKELQEKLLGLEIPRLKEEHILKIIDILPETKEELQNVLSGYTVTVNDKNLKAITDIVIEFKK